MANGGPEIEQLIQLLARLPGLGPRSARRAVLHLIKKKDALMIPLSAALDRAVAAVTTCEVCGNVDTRSPCAHLRRSAPRRNRPADRRRRRRRPLGARARRCRRRASTTSSAASSRRSTASAPTTSPSTPLLAPRRRVRRGRPGGERHGRGPDHRPLHHRPPRRLAASRSPASPTASPSAANSTISTKARSARR